MTIVNLSIRDVTPEELEWLGSLHLRSRSDQFFSGIQALVSSKKLRVMGTNLNLSTKTWDGQLFLQFLPRKKISLPEVCALAAKAGADDVYVMIDDIVCFWWD